MNKELKANRKLFYVWLDCDQLFISTENPTILVYGEINEIWAVAKSLSRFTGKRLTSICKCNFKIDITKLQDSINFNQDNALKLYLVENIGSNATLMDESRLNQMIAEEVPQNIERINLEHECSFVFNASEILKYQDGEWKTGKVH